MDEYCVHRFLSAVLIINYRSLSLKKLSRTYALYNDFIKIGGI